MTKIGTTSPHIDFQLFLAQSHTENPKISSAKLAKEFLQHYFSPWQGPRLSILEPDNIKQIHHSVFDYFHNHGGIGPNKQLYRSAWWDDIQQNCNLAQLPSLDKPAITIRDIQSRLLPTEAPVFKQWTAENSNGYPFDRLQQSLIPANTPISVQHVSRNGAWLLVTTASFFAWVKKSDIAWVSPSFMRQWQTASYAVATGDDVLPSQNINLPNLELRIGQLYPIQQKLSGGYRLLVAVSNTGKQAVIKALDCKTPNLRKFPMKITASNIAQLAEQMLGDPYGWGGMYGYRDCSATVMDLLANFGLWLPRNSQDQANILAGLSLVGKNSAEKNALITEHALPFLTLIHFPGHVGLYIGSHRNEHYFFHNGWGASGTVIMSLNQEEKPGESFLDNADKLMFFAT